MHIADTTAKCAGKMRQTDPIELAELLASQWGPSSLRYAAQRLRRCVAEHDLVAAREWRAILGVLRQMARRMK